jgi:hypothetical protein
MDCSIKNCPRRYYAKSFCKMHYVRWRRHGDPLIAFTSAGNRRIEACTICGGQVFGRGLCRIHWKRWRKYGDPLLTKNAPPGEHLRFLTDALAYEGDECLLWPFGKQRAGYGAVTGKTASNLMCEMAYGPAPEGMPEAAHSCDNPPCINKRHLRWASHAGNMADSRGKRKHIKPLASP